ncbi:MAG TPA: amidase [Ktedonobacteraceae bacterium]|nr:amidase [Ktedonobacteraceae bacterium]
MALEKTNLLTRSALELAELVRSGQVRSRELVEEALHRVEDNRDLNAFTLVNAEAALAEAEAIEPGDTRPFAGVPIAIKELAHVAGERYTLGSDLTGDYICPFDDHVVRRLRDAGFILLGRTNSPEFGIVPVTEPRRFGPTRNPWNTDVTAGGSSGGAAAAVAAGILPVAHGSDGGGSIRIPAACCGLVGLKPSRGRISAGPALGDSFLSTNGALTRTVADSAALLDVLAGYETGDATWAALPSEAFAVTAARAPRRLRVAMMVTSPIGTTVDPMNVQAVYDTAELLTSLGHRVEEHTPAGLAAPELFHAFNVLYAGSIAANIEYAARLGGRAVDAESIEYLSWGFYEHNKALTPAHYVGAMSLLQQHARTIISSFSTYDVLLTPSLGQRPLPIGTIDVNGDSRDEFRKAGAFTPFTAVWNTTGQPAISLPLYQGADGLPLGVQIVGPPLGEGLLLSLATELEAARPWAERLARP